MEQLKLLSMTAILTVLIWASADSLVNESITVGVSFGVIGEVGHPDMIVQCDAAQSFQLQLAGPRKEVALVRAATPLSIRLQIPDGPTGTTWIPLKKAIEEQWHEFPKLTVVGVQPSELAVAIDHLTRKDVEVVLKEGLALAYEAKPKLDRSVVTVSMRESLFKKEFEEPGRPLRIHLDPEPELQDHPKGESVAVLVTLVGRDLGFGDDAVFEPNTVLVTATVKAQRITAEIHTVPILLAVSFANLGKSYRADVPEGGPPLVTRTITVTGPAEEVRRLVAGDPPIGIVRLKDEHFERPGVQQGFRPEFQLPPGIELAKEPEPVVFTLIDTGAS